MIGPEGAIWVGDVLRTLGALGFDEGSDASTRLAVAELLGFTKSVGDDEPEVRPEERVDHPDEQPDEPSTPAPLVELLDPVGQQSVEVSLENVEISEELAAPLPAAATEGCDWYDPLLDHATANRFLRRALRTDCRTRRIEPKAAVRHLASLRRLDRLPMVSRRAYRRGGQILIDLGPAMSPFAGDQADLADRARTLSRGRIEVFGVNDVPVESVAVDDGTDTVWKTYHSPIPGAPVLILSSLGGGAPVGDQWSPTSRQWSDFVTALRRRGARVVALVPFDPARLSQAVANEVTAVGWDCSAADFLAAAERR